MVRVTGNNRSSDWSAADDGYSNDPRVVTVGAVGADGRVAGFNNAGACVLCAGLIGETGGTACLLTDRMGSVGWNRKSNNDDPEVSSYIAIDRAATVPCRRLPVRGVDARGKPRTDVSRCATGFDPLIAALRF